MKYAVLESGGKQYIAREGEMIEVDRLAEDVGSKIQWDDVLLLVDDDEVKVGTPSVKGAKVKGTLVEQIKAPKVLVFKYKTRERYRRKIGHRQRYSRVLIENISLTKPRKKAAAGKKTEADADANAPKKKQTKKAAQAKTTKKSAKPASTKKSSGKGASKRASAKKSDSQE